MKQKSIDATLAYFKEVELRRPHKRKVWTYAKDNHHGKPPFRNVPPHLRDIAWAEYNRLYDKAIREGKPITNGKRASMMGNAAYIAMYVRGSRKYYKWCCKWFRRRTLLNKWRSEQPQSTRRDPKSPQVFTHPT